MERKEFEVRLSSRSDRMLLAHTEFLARVSPSAARKLLTEFRILRRRLAENPHMFPYADDLDVPSIPPETYKKCVFFGRYKALFLIVGDCVHIDAIIDCRQENRELY